ncbi:MAG: hypothetical protein IT473_03985 [Lysobacter sp.]|nr:hypothetical protein [Lysobacter sp.]
MSRKNGVPFAACVRSIPEKVGMKFGPFAGKIDGSRDTRRFVRKRAYRFGTAPMPFHVTTTVAVSKGNLPTIAGLASEAQRPLHPRRAVRS